MNFIEEIKKAIKETRFDSIIYINGRFIETERAIFEVTDEGILIRDSMGNSLHKLPLQDQDEVEAVLAYHWG